MVNPENKMQQLFSRRDGWWGLKSVKYPKNIIEVTPTRLLYGFYILSTRFDSVISNCQKIKKSWCFEMKRYCCR
jgi:hypothetical protein